MVFDEPVRILSSAEQADFYNPPVFSQHDQRYFFSLNDIEIAACQKFRSRKIRCMFVVLLGYFKAKPVVLKLGYHQIKKDIKYVFQSVLCSSGFGPFNLTSKENERIYQKIFHLCGYGRWQVRTHKKDLIGHLLVQIEAWVAPRSLFDTTIEYLSLQKIAIPGYSTLQKIISHVVKQAQNQFVAKVIQATSPKLQPFIAEVMSETGELMLHDFRQCAKNFTCKEMEKELFVYKHLNTWMPEINTALQSLSL